MTAIIRQIEPTKFDVYMTTSLGSFDLYTPVYDLLNKSGSEVSITFYLSITEGSEQTANLLRAVIGKSKAVKTAVIIGDMADTGLLFLDAFDRVAAFDEAVLIFAPTYLNVAGEEEDGLDSFNANWAPTYYQARYRKFVPKGDITLKLLVGKSVIMTGRTFNENVAKLKKGKSYVR